MTFEGTVYASDTINEKQMICVHDDRNVQVDHTFLLEYFVPVGTKVTITVEESDAPHL